MNQTVAGSTHGEQRPTYVCRQVVQTLRDRRPRGISCAEDPSDRDCAWSADCEEKRVGTGDGRTDELTDRMNIALLCGSCFDTARRTNGVFN